MTVSLINLCYLVKYQPFEEKKLLKLEVMNEVTNLILLYQVICFSGLIPEAEDRYLLGWAFIASIGANMLVHFTLLVISTIVSLKDCKKRCCTKKKPEEEPAVETKKELSIIYEEEF